MSCTHTHKFFHQLQDIKNKKLLSVCRCYTSKLPAGCSSLLFFPLSLSFLFFIIPSSFYININTYLSSSTTHLCPGHFAYNLTYRYVDRRTAGPALNNSLSKIRFSLFILFVWQQRWNPFDAIEKTRYIYKITRSISWINRFLYSWATSSSGFCLLLQFANDVTKASR